MDNHLQLTETPAADAAGAPEAAVPKAAAAAAAVKRQNAEEKTGFWRDQWKRAYKYRKLLWFILPAALFTLIFSYVPMFGVLFAFKGEDFNLYTSSGGVIGALFEGSWTFENFGKIFSNPDVGNAIANTLIINVIRLALCFPLSILIAVMLSELKQQWLAKVILIIITIPNFLSWAIVIGIWAGFFSSDFGILGRITGNLMTDPNWFKPLVVFLSAWKGAGWGCILFYSAIMSIDKTYYESATLEGANKLQKMWYLTLPSIMPTIALMLVLNISGMMAVGFEQVWTMMNLSAELQNTQMTLDTYLYNISIVNADDIPFATALGVANGLIGLFLMLVGNAITTKTLKRGLW